MKIFDYPSYEAYVEAQIEGNVRKIQNSYVDPISLTYVVEYLHNELNLSPSTILCHGTRRGLEQKYFIKAFEKFKINPEVIGTEISHTATNYENTIQWDFHNVKEEWLGNVDIIYSNSFDHSYKPIECLDTWMSCLSKKGICIIEYSEICDSKSGVTDPFGATLQEYKNFITKKYNIVEVLTNTGLKDKGESYKGLRYFILIQNKD